jgi:hypothetical protein
MLKVKNHVLLCGQRSRNFDNAWKLDGKIDSVPVSEPGTPPGSVWMEIAKGVGKILERS